MLDRNDAPLLHWIARLPDGPSIALGPCRGEHEAADRAVEAYRCEGYDEEHLELMTVEVAEAAEVEAIRSGGREARVSVLGRSLAGRLPANDR